MSRWRNRLNEILAEGPSAQPTSDGIVQNVQIAQKPPVQHGFARSERFERSEATSADAFEERAAIVQYEAGVPREWAQGFARLCIMARPAGVPLSQWRLVVNAGGTFINRWAARAAALGWGTESIFGCSADAPAARHDLQGLVWLIGEGELFALTDSTATIRTTNGSRLTYRRTVAPPNARAVAAWELDAGSPA
jgi:hypothetical protein